MLGRLGAAAALAALLLVAGVSGQPAGGCVSTGQAMTDPDSPCYAFTQGHTDADNIRISGYTNAAVRAEVAANPQPSPACCTIARPFVQQGCGCNARFIDLAGNFGHPKSEIVAGYRVLKYSSCFNSTNGGAMADPCNMSGPQSV